MGMRAIQQTALSHPATRCRRANRGSPLAFAEEAVAVILVVKALSSCTHPHKPHQANCSPRSRTHSARFRQRGSAQRSVRCPPAAAGDRQEIHRRHERTGSGRESAVHNPNLGGGVRISGGRSMRQQRAVTPQPNCKGRSLVREPVARRLRDQKAPQLASRRQDHRQALGGPVPWQWRWSI
jgi:hypothetical protein